MMFATRLTPIAVSAALGLALVAASYHRADALRCENYQCGLNTAELRGTPIRGLSVLGSPNPDGVRLIPESLTLQQWLPASCGLGAFHARTGYRLDVANGALLARTSSGALLPPSCVQGATFDIDVPVQKETITVIERVNVRINELATIATWFTDTSLASEVPTFQLVNTATGASLCSLKEGWMESWQSSGHAPGTGYKWRTSTDHAVIVQGETYDDRALVDTARSDGSWFNIACAGSALAKMRLMGYDPMSRWSDRAERQSTLKMFTARYLVDDGRARTVTGTPLLWISPRAVTGGAPIDPAQYLLHPMYYGWPVSTDLGPIEARWLANGTACLSHLRIWTKGKLQTNLHNEAADLRALVTAGGPAPCTDSTPAGVYWHTYTVDHRL